MKTPNRISLFIFILFIIDLSMTVINLYYYMWVYESRDTLLM